MPKDSSVFDEEIGGVFCTSSKDMKQWRAESEAEELVQSAVEFRFVSRGLGGELKELRFDGKRNTRDASRGKMAVDNGKNSATSITLLHLAQVVACYCDTSPFGDRQNWSEKKGKRLLCHSITLHSIQGGRNSISGTAAYGTPVGCSVGTGLLSVGKNACGARAATAFSPFRFVFHVLHAE